MKSYSITIYNHKMERLAILQNATNVSYTERMNRLWTAQFSLPTQDPKNEYCKAFHFAEIYKDRERVEIFRILPNRYNRGGDEKYTHYSCEHVLSTLLDNVMFGYHQVGNLEVTTPQVLQHILNQQDPIRWKLGQVDFQHQFEYNWENENLLAAIFSTANPFDEEYLFTYNTTTYPWTLNLVKAEQTPSCEIRYRKNMLGLEREEDPTNIVTRLYCLGYGEGVNQLNIKGVNNGVPYLEADTVDQFGVKESIWVDRSMEDANTLMANGKAILEKLKWPRYTYKVSALALKRISKSDYDEFKAGKMVKVIDQEEGVVFRSRIQEVNIPDVHAPECSVVIQNEPQNIVSSISELQSRTRINETYAQGATNLLQVPFSDNADPNNPAVLNIYIPREMVRINKLILNYRLERFRAYSRAIKGGGAVSTSTKDGGGTSTSTESGGGAYPSTEDGGGRYMSTLSGGSDIITSRDGGGEYNTSNAGVWTLRSAPLPGDYMNDNGDHNHGIPDGTPLLMDGGGSIRFRESGRHVHSMYSVYHTHPIELPDHTHPVVLPAHTHPVDIPDHTHKVTVPTHTHNLFLKDHTHQVTLGDHIHEIEYGIFQGTRATEVTIKVDGVPIPIGPDPELDIIEYLSTDDEGKILRGTWHTVEIVPNVLSRVSANIFMQVFTNSRGGGDY